MPRTVALPDGAQLAFEVLGAEHLPRKAPIVLVGGISSLRGDWERLATALARIRPVLVYDHRGMGDSKLASKDEKFTIETLARDLLLLLEYLQWKELAICGFSMGGVVTQQLLFLPYHPTRPTPLPFHISHVILAGSLCAPLRDPNYGLPVPRAPDHPLTEQEKLDIARATLELSFDPEWLADPWNASRFEAMLPRMISGRPSRVILRQMKAMNHLDFADMHPRLPRTLPVLVVHGTRDRVVPPSCADDIRRRIPWAQSVAVAGSVEGGGSPGSVPSLDFGHSWYEYFDVAVWVGIVETFLAAEGPGQGRLQVRL